jgi:hypothetical protein
LAEKILTSKSALEGERKHVTVLFADLKGLMKLLADRDPEEARQLLDPVLEQMMDACVSPHGWAPMSIGVWQPSNIHRSPCFSRVFWVYAHSEDLAPATFELGGKEQ